MAAPMIHRTSAAKRVYIAQVAGVLVLGAGAAVWAAGLPGVKPPSMELPPVEPVVLKTDAASGGTGGLPTTLFEDIGYGLESIRNAPVPVAPTSGPGTGPSEPDVGPLADSTDEVSFVGSVLSASRRIAVFRVGDEQVWVPEGEEREGIHVLDVGRDNVRFEKGGEELELERAPRKKGFLTQLAGTAGPRQNPGMNSGRPSPMELQAQAEMDAVKAAEVAGESVNVEGSEEDAQARMDRIRRAQERARERALRRGEQR